MNTTKTTTTTASISTRSTYLRTLRTLAAVASVLFGALTLTGCPAGDGAPAMDGGAPVTPDASTEQPDTSAYGGVGGGANAGAGGTTATPSNGGSSGGGLQPSHADAGTPPADAATKAPAPNQTCTVAAQCPSGLCVDGACCDTACNGPCESCALTGKVGTCSPVKNGADDTCTGDSTCDGAGACRNDLGRTCSSSSQCASGNCVDGVCCATAACGTCQSCGVPEFRGTCAPLAKFIDDGDCSDANTCSGLGDCRAKNGSACTAATDCASLNCVDGVCCNEACSGTCFSCNQAQSPGTCRAIDGAADPSATTVCSGAKICAVAADGQPACKLKNGQTCTTNPQCASGTCRTTYVPPDPNDFYDPGSIFSSCE